MYPRQIIASGAVGAVAGYAFFWAGSSGFHAFLIAVTGFIITRWLLATIFRAQYWYHRGTRGAYEPHCPSCRERRWRTSEDWILRCYKCGWKPGLPIIRWLTHNVVSRQAQRSLSLGKVLTVGACLVIILAGLSPTGAGITGLNVSFNTSPGADEPESNQGLNETLVERLIWRYTNEKRAQNGLSNVTYSKELTAPARRHSANMAEHDYVGHTEPNGETAQERYQAYCDYDGSGYVHGENVFGAWYERRMESWKEDRTVYLTTESEVAQYLVNGWMRSEGHRENILHSSWNSMAAGIHVTNEGRVYATQVFCAS